MPVPPPSACVPPSIGAGLHAPLWQVKPEQHSLVSWHAAFSPRQVQCPPVQSM